MLRILAASAFFLVLSVSTSFAQCNGQAPAFSICGNNTGSQGLPNFFAFAPLTNAAGGTVLGNPTTSSAPVIATTHPILGIPGTSTGQIGLSGLTSGTATIAAQSAAGTPTLLLPNTSGTFAVNASAPLILSATTGALTCPTCATSTLNGQPLTSTSDTNVTITLGGTPSTALLNPASITMSWSGLLGLSRGGTNANLSVTGGTSQVLQQTTVGGAITVGQLAAANLSNGTTGSGAVVLATNATITTPTLSGTVAGTYTLGGTPSVTLVNSGTIAGALCATSGGLILYSSATNCFNVAASTITVGTTNVASGTNTYLLYDNLGVLGNEAATSVVFGTGTLSLAGNLSTSGAFASSFSMSGAYTYTFPAGTSSLAALNLTGQTLSGGATVTTLTLSTGNITVNCGSRPLQYVVNGGAFTITAPSSDGSCVVYVGNNASAGAITFSGFNVGVNTGDALTTTNGSSFFIYVIRINGVSTYSIKALQ